MSRNKLVMPFVKWVGGKRQLLCALEGLLPAGGVREYCEPFVGGGAVLFHLQPGRAYVNDLTHSTRHLHSIAPTKAEASSIFNTTARLL